MNALEKSAKKHFDAKDQAFQRLQNVGQQVLTGIKKDPKETNRQQLFVDIILRRFLLYTNLWYLAATSNKALALKLDLTKLPYL
jgi:hypothetical protein